MRKKLEMIIEDTCSSCPYCQYDGHYSMSHDSGWDCHNPNKPNIINNRYIVDRIVDEGKESKYGFPPIPEWCPLEEVAENVVL